VGPPSDFGGAIIPNPNNIQGLPDTQAPGDRLDGGTLSTQNFQGKTPLHKVSSPSKAPDSLPADFAAWDKPADTLPANFAGWDNHKAAPDNRSLLDRLANDPNKIPLDSYTHATERGLANIGQGAAQAVQGTVNFLDPRTHDDHEKEVSAVNPLALPVYRMFRSIGHTVEDAKALAQEYRRDGGPTAQEVGDVAGVAGGNLAGGEIIGAGVRVAPKAVSAISDTAQAAADRAAAIARKVTPKQAAVAGGTAAGAAFGHGTTSAYFGSKLGHVAEMLLGPDRANTPIFQKAASLDEATDALAETIARDIKAQVQAGPLGDIRATGAKGAAETGEALGGIKTPNAQPSTQLPAAFQSLPPKAPPVSGTVDAPFKGAATLADKAAAKSLVEDALKTHTGDVIDQMVPGKNAAVKSRVDFYLKKGDVAGAESELDKGAKAWKNLGFDREASKQASAENTAGTLPQGTSVVQRAQQLKEQMMSAAGTDKPAWQALDRQPVPSTNDIRARVQREAAAPKPGTRADLMEDKGIDQQWQWHLDRHGWAAESEARREFIARNSTGMTKGELGKRFARGQSGSGAQTAAQPASASGTGADDLVDILQKSLEQARKPKAQQ